MKANCDGSNRGTVRMTLRHKQAVVRRSFSSSHVGVKLAKLTLSAQQSLKKKHEAFKQEIWADDRLIMMCAL